MKRAWMALVLAVGLLMMAVPATYAAESEDVAAVVAETGVYVEAGTSASESRVGELVSALRSEGENISMVVLADEPLGGATTFADAVANRLGAGVVVVVAPETVGAGGISEFFTDVEIEEALDASLDGDTDGEVLEIFSATLLGTAVAETPDAASAEPAPAAGSSDGGGSGFLIFLLIAGVAVIGFLWWRSQQNKTKGPKLHPKLAEAKEAVQQQINAVANDLIDMEEEVRAADNERVDDFYDGAANIYGDVTEEFVTANTPQAILDLSNELDQAIWQLDSAEAILDGKPLPQQPVPKRLPAPETVSQSTAQPADGSTLPPRPQYDRRSSRRSSPAGPGLMDILMGMAGAMMAGRARSGPSRTARTSGSPGGGGLLGGRGPLSGLGTTSGSRRVPPSNFPSVPSRRSSSGSRRRGSTGRVRTGGKRRRR